MNCSDTSSDSSLVPFVELFVVNGHNDSKQTSLHFVRLARLRGLWSHTDSVERPLSWSNESEHVYESHSDL